MEFVSRRKFSQIKGIEQIKRRLFFLILGEFLADKTDSEDFKQI